MLAVEERWRVEKLFYFYLTFQRKDSDILEMSKYNADGCSINKKKIYILPPLIFLKEKTTDLGGTGLKKFSSCLDLILYCQITICCSLISVKSREHSY